VELINQQRIIKKLYSFSSLTKIKDEASNFIFYTAPFQNLVNISDCYRSVEGKHNKFFLILYTLYYVLTSISSSFSAIAACAALFQKTTPFL
jgi:hypothetical protein